MATDTQDKKSYKDSLNLPQTSFAMEAKLVQNEPARLKKWQEAKLYEQTLAARADATQWILHDGPPFANGDIHIGHVINKTLKDVIIRFRTMEGYQTPYVPGWDCHGLPIEHKIQEEIKKEGKNIREMSVLDVRKRCYEYADKYAAVQSEQFQRLGILGDWANPYLTMRPAYEAETLEVFARIVEKGLVYRKLKPVPWSIANQTALADAELEYQDVVDNSVYVEFPLNKPMDGLPAYLLVWTTTPWTLPANLAIAVHAEVDYSLVRYQRGGEDRVALVATDLRERVFAKANLPYTVVRTGTYAEVLGDNLEYRHPFIDRTGQIVTAEYVTTTDGTGLVHTAPGHGEDDYETGIREGLPIYSPVLFNGQFDDTVPEWLRGKNVFKANPEIVAKLNELGVLFAEEKITHSYPHDWRSKTPIIFRATEQWFVAMDKPGDEWRRDAARDGPERRSTQTGRFRAGVGEGPTGRNAFLAARLVHLAPARVGTTDPRLLQRQGRAAAHAGVSARHLEAIPRQRIGRMVHRFAHRIARRGFRVSQGIRAGETTEGEGHLRRLVRIGKFLAVGAAMPAGSAFPCRSLSRRFRPASRLVSAFAPPGPGGDWAAAVQAGAHAWICGKAGRHEGQQERQGIRQGRG